MRREMIAFGREMRGAQRVEKTLVRRAHRRGRDDGRGARGPVGRGKARAICFGKGWARQFRGRFAVVHGTPFLDIHPMRPIISAIQSISCVTIIVQTDEIKLSSLYNPFQKAWSAAATAAGRSAIAQCPAPSITVSGVPVFAA